MKIQHIVPILLLAGYCTVSAQTTNAPAEPTSIKLDNRGVPFGTLGFPVGSYLTIEGVKEKPQIMQNQHWLVDTVNGSKLTERVVITFDSPQHLLNLPVGGRFIVKGYETLAMVGEPPALEAAAKDSGQNLEQLQHMQQPAWRLEYRFVVTSIVAPKN